jgi:hypothetical protein
VKSRFPIYLAAGLVVVGAIVLFILDTTKGAHLELRGWLLKVRSVAVDEKASIVVIDFRVKNIAEVPFLVRDARIEIQTPGGQNPDSFMLARADTEHVFAKMPLIGPKFNDVLAIKDRIKPGETIDRMVAMRIELPESEVEARKSLKLRIEDTDGAVCELVETRK